MRLMPGCFLADEQPTTALNPKARTGSEDLDAPLFS